jgi:uncharacterized membrane protein YeaQ/YmgE (transglycosylase-associated protein family)
MVPACSTRPGVLVEDLAMVMNILLWAAFGLIAGVVARYIGSQPSQGGFVGLLMTILLGIIGAVVGGWVSSELFKWDVSTFSIAGFLVAVAGALVVLFLYRLLTSTRRAA